MKRFWFAFLAIVAAVTIANTANAQSGTTGEIGSYQSILSRAGYGNGQSGIISAAPVSSAPAVSAGGCTGPNCAYSNGSGTYGYTAVPQATVPQATIPQATIPQATMVPQAVLPQAAIPQAVPNIAAPVGPAYAGSVEGGAVIDQGYVGNNVVNAAPSPIINYTQGPTTWSQPVVSQPIISQPVISQPVYSPPVITQPLYQPVQTVPVFVSGQSFASRPKSNRVFSLFGVSLRRDYEDGVRLGYGNDGDFFSDDSSNGSFSGLGAVLTSRKANGTGWEVRYWGLDDRNVENFGPGGTHLRGLDDVFHAPASGTARSVFDNAEDLSLDRTSRINSLAFNLLRNGGRYKSCLGCGNYELVGGFRLFEFDEDLQFAANSASVDSRYEYALETENLLAGFQVGGRNEICIGSRLRLASGANVGVFNNRINTSQRIFDNNGVESTVYSGNPFNFQDEKDDVAFLGEFNTGLIFPVSHRLRLNAGYKVVGVAGVALAADQIPRDFMDKPELLTAKSNGSLLLHGFYFGGEGSF